MTMIDHRITAVGVAWIFVERNSSVNRFQRNPSFDNDFTQIPEKLNTVIIRSYNELVPQAGRYIALLCLMSIFDKKRATPGKRVKMLSGGYATGMVEYQQNRLQQLREQT